VDVYKADYFSVGMTFAVIAMRIIAANPFIRSRNFYNSNKRQV
jgi:hypothetical protein